MKYEQLTNTKVRLGVQCDNSAMVGQKSRELERQIII